MKISFTDGFVDSLLDQVDYIAKDKPSAAREFKNNLLKNILKDLKQPFNYRKSIYFEEEVIRDYIFKAYTIVYKIDIEKRKIVKNKKTKNVQILYSSIVNYS